MYRRENLWPRLLKIKYNDLYNMSIHNLAVVSKGARLGENVTIEPFANIYEDVEIGDNCWIGSGAIIMNGARIGNNCKIFPGAVIAGEPQDLKFNGEYSTVQIGARTTIRECATVNRGSAAKGTTIVGEDCLLMAYTHVAHDCIIGNRCVLVNYSGIAGEVEIGDWSILGGGTMIHQFVKVGEHVMFRGGSLVGKDVPPYIIAGREPLSYCGLNTVGLRRRGFQNDKINEIQDIYRVLFNQGMNYADAIRYIEENFGATEERDTIINFVRSSKRGILKGLLDE